MRILIVKSQNPPGWNEFLRNDTRMCGSLSGRQDPSLSTEWRIDKIAALLNRRLVVLSSK
jgi:hypothetical protein